MPKVLIIDDDRSVRHTVERGLNGYCGISVESAADGDIGLELIETHKPLVVLLDVYLPNHNGLELFRKIRAIDRKLPVIFITGDTSSETAIQAMRVGAFDYLSKPLDITQIKSLTLSAIKARRMMDEPVAFHVGDGDSCSERFIGKSKAMIEVYKSIGRVAAENVAVLIRGESGCGKELVARALVQHSDRSDKPFVAVNCAAIPDQLLESELFGHEKGAFTGAERRRIGRFEQCDGGTIFLDEIGDMSTIIQGKVLRLLQEQKFERVGGTEMVTTNVRVLAATNRPLENMVKDNQFREDLLYRLNGFTIDLPPLRERREDIPILLEYFLRRAKSDMGKMDIRGIASDAYELLIKYDWPGNVRQLQSAIRHSMINTSGTVIGVENLPMFVSEIAATDTNQAKPVCSVAEESSSAIGPECGDGRLAIEVADQKENSIWPSAVDDFQLFNFIDERLAAGSTNIYAEALEQMERRLFAKVLDVTNGNQSKTAEVLGITRGKVRDRIAAFGISLERTVVVGKQ
ncbi:sigma-54-dependent transcriptional regulator [Pirellulaceae bacterium SH449]